MLTKRKLNNALTEQVERNQRVAGELRSAQKELSEINSFIDFLNSKISEEGWQLCYLKKWDEENGVYLAFLLAHTFSSNPSFSYAYTLYGYISSNPRFPVYQGEFDWVVAQSMSNENRNLSLGKCYIKDDGLRGKGIGTAAMDIIKDIARQLQCGKIIGKREVLVRTSTEKDRHQEESALIGYYKKNGFIQSTDTNKIVHTVQGYRNSRFT